MTAANPAAPLLRITATTRGIWALVVECCYCGRDHHHGGGSTAGQPSLGWRQSHCRDGARPYWIAPADQTCAVCRRRRPRKDAVLCRACSAVVAASAGTTAAVRRSRTP